MYEIFTKKLLAAQKIAIFMHINPDADCIGSSLAMYKFLINYGKQAEVFLEPGNMIRKNLFVYPNISIINQSRPSKYDLGICLDCATVDRMGNNSAKIFFDKCDERIWIDHHIYPYPIDDSIIETTSASTSQILYKIFMEIDGTLIDKEVAFCLFGALAADTGVFSFSSTTAETMKIASELISFGIDNNFIVDKIYREKSICEFNLMVEALGKTQFFYNNKMAVISFFSSDFMKTGCDIYSTEGIINNLIEIDEVILAIAIAEEKENVYKVSIRSKDPLDCSAYARIFGGGGHKNASGCKFKLPYEKTLETLVKTACTFIKC
ncbi:MAG: bifunctional oligoribonuclease/PAP phosphatase NrnA [Clostridiales bacterium]|nr:bifunctional oligoribonuclease/PAP phosphatase NrnA [Clostridiales bacterium]